MTDSAVCPECRVDPCYCDTVVDDVMVPFDRAKRGILLGMGVGFVGGASLGFYFCWLVMR